MDSTRLLDEGAEAGDEGAQVCFDGVADEAVLASSACTELGIRGGRRTVARRSPTQMMGAIEAPRGIAGVATHQSF